MMPKSTPEGSGIKNNPDSGKWRQSRGEKMNFRGKFFLSLDMRILYFLWDLFVISAFATLAWSQATASISGTVVDNSDAVVPGAAVTVRSPDTGSIRRVATDGAGIYRVLSLPVGRYEVKAEHVGFRAAVKNEVTLTVGQEALVDFRLEIGEVK